MAEVNRSFEDFPLRDLLPKKETQVETFLKKYPESDGSGVLVAIFDSGVDPGAPGLTRTSKGERKIVDLIDCSGSGDVDTSTIATRNHDGTIIGKSGRKLKIPDTWTNPSGEYRIGIKSAFSLFPESAVKRIKNERKEENWNPAHLLATANGLKNLHEFESKTPFPESEAEKLEHANLKAVVEVLSSIEKMYKDGGPVYDCILFHDGEHWRACIDTTENGDLSKCKLLGIYRETGDYGRFSNKDMVNYSINVYDEGNVLSIVTNSSSHGTHVACIAGANFEFQPELNGLAPGAQIISMQIGDNRINGMETGSAMIRAMIAAVENKVDIINMSYGEAVKWTNNGRVVDMMNKMVEEHQIIFISSAGNNGPALSTVGCPGGTSENIIGVGAYVSPEMMTTEYSLLEKMPGTQYTWSSRGPCVDGSLGVCISAPGGAITSVPNWTLSKSQLMNGTSMSSPNACGSVAVLLSALKRSGIEYSHSSIRRCLENTALRIKGLSLFTQGYGMVQIDKAFDYMNKLASRPLSKYVNFLIRWCEKRGVYIREPCDFARPNKQTITITPKFLKDTDNNLKVEFNLDVSLVSTETWVSCPAHLNITNGTRNFPILIQTDGLKPGHYYAEIEAYEHEYVHLGPVFRVPISVIIPKKVNDDHVDQTKLSFKVSECKRFFYFVPNHATWATLSLKSLTHHQDFRYSLHCLQIIDDSTYFENEFMTYTILSSDAKRSQYHFKVQGGVTLEVCLARWWTMTGESEILYELSFHCLQPLNKEIILDSSKGFSTVDVINESTIEKIDPSASLTHHVIPLIPKDHVIKPLGLRDLLFNEEPIYSLELTYNFSLSKASDVIIIVPLFHDLLYENKYESQLWMIFDSNKALCRCGDAFPAKYDYVCKLQKGDYVTKLMIRHSDVDALESLKNMNINVQITLPIPVAVDVYSSRKNMLEKKKYSAVSLTPLSRARVYAAFPDDDKYPSGAKCGQFLTGKITYAASEPAKKASWYPLRLCIPPLKGTDNKNKVKEESMKVEDEYEEAYGKFIDTWITKLNGSPLIDDLISNRKDKISALNAYLDMLDSSKDRSQNFNTIVSTAKKIIEQIDEKDILAYFAMKVDPESDAAKREKEMNKIKGFLINAYYKMGLAVADGLLAQATTDTKESTTAEESSSGDATNFQVEELDTCFRTFQKFVDASDVKMLMFIVRHGMVHKQFGRSLKALLKYFNEEGFSKTYYDIYLQLLHSCGWNHAIKNAEDWSLLKFPSTYELF